jgi:hypothetical protein
MTREMTNRMRLIVVLTVVAFLAAVCRDQPSLAEPAGATQPAPTVGAVAPADANAPAGPEEFSALAVQKAIKKGVEYLRKTQGADGSWPGHDDKYPVGHTAIATCAILESDLVKVNDPTMAKALDWLGKRQVPVAMLRRPRPGEPATAASTRPSLPAKVDTLSVRHPSTREISWRANAFLAAMKRSGMWNSPYTPFLHTDVLMLMLSTTDGSYGCDCFGDGKGSGDNFYSQYGFGGVWAAVQADMEVPRKYWDMVLKHWQDCQNPDGGWALAAGKPSTAMATAGGMAALTVCMDNLFAEKYLDCKPDPNGLAPINRALAWMEKNFQPAMADPNGALAGPAGLYPFLHAVQYAGQATGRKFFGGADWYKLGAAELLRRQRPDGSWDGKDGAVCDTAYAMLFLEAKNHPVAISKLQYDGDWNNRPRDLAGLTRWLVGASCGLWMRWQVVPMNASVEQWHDAPVLYISGTKDPNFSAGDIDKLRGYVQEGGTILSVRECDGNGFGEGMRRAYEKMFPEYRMRPIDANHRMLSVNYKLKARAGLLEITNGVRTLAIHSDIDMSRSWQLGLGRVAKGDFEFVGNAMLYITDGRIVERGRVELPWPAAPARAPARTIQLARLRYDGNWDPEPLAWVRFSRLLTTERAIGVEAQPIDILKLPTCGAKVAHLTGTAAFLLSAEQRATIKKFVAGGGTLLIDAAGGSRRFAESATKMLGEMFGPSALRRIPPEATIYNMPDMRIEEVRYTRTARIMLPDSRPGLRGTTIDGRIAVIFSDMDITAGLLGTDACKRVGYSPKSAFEIARNVLLYAADGPPAESPKK